MENKCVIFGANDFGDMIRYYLEKYKKTTCVAYTMDKAYIKEDTRNGLPVVAFEDLEAEYPPEEYTVLLAIGYSHMNDVRKDKFYQVKAKGYKLEDFIHPSVYCDYAKLGEGNIVLENATLAYHCEVGNANIIWNNVQISHECIVGDFNFFAGSTTLAGKTIVKNNCFLGLGCSVIGTKTMEDYTLVGAGAYMGFSSEEGAVYVPARTKRLEGKTSRDFF